jgi:IclR family KDG regulon transcriptional repressor
MRSPSIHTSTKRQKPASRRYHVEAVSRAVRLLRELRSTPQLPLAQLARSAELSDDVAERTLATLQQHGFVRASNGHGEAYELGLAWLRLADVRRRQVDIRLVALPIMRRIRDAVDETVILSIQVGNRRVNIDYVESTQAIRRVTQPGFETPLHIGATGRALLSALTPGDFAAYLRSTRLVVLATKTTISEAQLIKEVDGVRSKGYAVAFREITSDTAAVSAPVHDHTGDIIAAVTISCPEERFTPALKDACIRHITAGARDVSHALGYQGCGT